MATWFLSTLIVSEHTDNGQKRTAFASNPELSGLSNGLSLLDFNTLLERATSVLKKGLASSE